MRTRNQAKLVNLLNQYDTANDIINYKKCFAKLDKTNVNYERFAKWNSKKNNCIVFIDFPTEPIIF